FRHLGLATTRVDMTNLAALESAFTPRTRLVWLETPTTPMLKVTDIAAVAKLVQSRRASTGGAGFQPVPGVPPATSGAGMTVAGPGPSLLTVVHNTFAPPSLQNPPALGADIVTPSCTKYIGGHSDVVGGALMVNDDDL